MDGGFVLVPKEPTREMWAAAGDALVKLVGAGVLHHDKLFEAAWEAALSAAEAALHEDERRVLECLGQAYARSQDYCHIDFATIIGETGLERPQVARSARSLRRKGFATFATGLRNEDGELFGSGYGITSAGRAHLANAAVTA